MKLIILTNNEVFKKLISENEKSFISNYSITPLVLKNPKDGNALLKESDENLFIIDLDFSESSSLLAEIKSSNARYLVISEQLGAKDFRKMQMMSDAPDGCIKLPISLDDFIDTIVEFKQGANEFDSVDGLKFSAIGDKTQSGIVEIEELKIDADVRDTIDEHAFQDVSQALDSDENLKIQNKFDAALSDVDSELELSDFSSSEDEVEDDQTQEEDSSEKTIVIALDEDGGTKSGLLPGLKINNEGMDKTGPKLVNDDIGSLEITSAGIDFSSFDMDKSQGPELGDISDEKEDLAEFNLAQQEDGLESGLNLDDEDDDLKISEDIETLSLGDEDDGLKISDDIETLSLGDEDDDLHFDEDNQGLSLSEDDSDLEFSDDIEDEDKTLVTAPLDIGMLESEKKRTAVEEIELDDELAADLSFDLPEMDSNENFDLEGPEEKGLDLSDDTNNFSVDALSLTETDEEDLKVDIPQEMPTADANESLELGADETGEIEVSKLEQEQEDPSFGHDEFTVDTGVLGKVDVSDPNRTETRLGPSEEKNMYMDDLSRLRATIQDLRTDREKLLGTINNKETDFEVLKGENLTLKSELEETRAELKLIENRHKAKLSEVRTELEIVEDKKVLLDEKYRHVKNELDRNKQRVKIDINQVKQRERELEGQLELIKMDTESQVHTRDAKILDLKKKIDALEFNMDNMAVKEQEVLEDKVKLEERLNKIMSTLRGSIRVLEDDVDSEQEV